MIEIKNINFSYGKHMVFDNVTMTLEPGMIYGLLGQNGVGKSTLLKLISGLLKLKNGSCTVNGYLPFKREPSFLSNIYFLPEDFSGPDTIIKTYAKNMGIFYPHFSMDKFESMEYVTVLDFIGNNYDRAVQIAMALGTLGKTTYMEKAYLKEMIRTNFESLDIPEVKIEIDDLSKEEIVNFIDKTNFNSRVFLEKDYKNFKSYINNGTYPTHMDFLNSDVSPDLIRIIKSTFGGSKNKSYYNFLKKIEEDAIPMFSEQEVNFINNMEDLLPLARLDEYLIIEQAIKENTIDLKRIEGINEHITDKTLENAYNNLKSLGIVENSNIDLTKLSEGDFKDYLLDTLNYGIVRYNREFGEYTGLFKLYRNYYKEQASRIMLKNGILQKGTYYEDDIAYIFAGIKKGEEGRLNYKDKFINNKIFQWESIANVSQSEKEHLRNSKKAHLFIRKMESEDTVTLPYTYFGLGTFTNERDSFTEEDGKKHPTLLYDIVLDDEVPEDYYIDFEIPNSVQ